MFKWLFKSKNLNEKSQEATSRALFEKAYKTRFKEIESLRKYDRGEKTITPRDLKEVVRSL